MTPPTTDPAGKAIEVGTVFVGAHPGDRSWAKRKPDEPAPLGSLAVGYVVGHVVVNGERYNVTAPRREPRPVSASPETA